MIGDLSQFITEDIYILSSASSGEQVHKIPEIAPSVVEEPPAKPSREDRVFKLGIVTGELSKKDKDLLEKILEAVSITADEVLMADQVSDKAKKWMVFDESVGTIEAKSPEDRLIINCRPLPELHENVTFKRELWGLLKNHFDI